MKFPITTCFFKSFFFILILLSTYVVHAVVPSKILICGVCKNVERFLENDFANIETLGGQFEQYNAIIYENNSTDNTKSILRSWAKNNPHAILISENLTGEEMREGARCFDKDEDPSRMELIAKARNRVLDIVKSSQFDDFDFVVMVDLDFSSRWPIEEIVNTIQANGDWDSVSANGISGNGMYYDRYAFRNSQFPFGPEIFSEDWWNEIYRKPLYFTEEEWLPVYSAFGGLAIYRRNSLLECSYTGYVTDDLSKVIKNILVSNNADPHQIQKYLNLIGWKDATSLQAVPIKYQFNSGYHNFSVCCEHVTLHASMILKGYDKLYINPKMILQY